jgi:hypothetical protein
LGEADLNNLASALQAYIGPTSMRTLFTGALLVVGLGYMFAMLYVFAAHSGADGKPGLSVDDIKITYSGNNETTGLVPDKGIRSFRVGSADCRNVQRLVVRRHVGDFYVPDVDLPYPGTSKQPPRPLIERG